MTNACRRAVPSGEITAVHLNFDTTGFIVVDHRDVPGRNIVALIENDQPCLAERAIRHVAEPILCPDQQFADNGAGHWRSRAEQHKEIKSLLQEPFKEEVEEIILNPCKLWKAAASFDEHG